MPKPCTDCGQQIEFVVIDAGTRQRHDCPSKGARTGQTQSYGPSRQGPPRRAAGAAKEDPSESTFPFGEFKGQKVFDVVKNDRGYVEWCLEHATASWLQNACREALKLGNSREPVSAQTRDDAW